MARDHARLDLHIWSDEDFRDLSMVAKLVYVQLISQPKLSYAGILDLAVKRWTRAHPDLDPAAMRAALAELHAGRFVLVDHDTEEVLVRSFVRNDQLYKQPNVLRAALRAAFGVESVLLRRALADELRRLPVEITGPAPAVAAVELEAGARELPASVMAAMSVRGSTRTTPMAKPVGDSPATVTAERLDAADESAPNPSANPSPNPSPRGRGEGSRELETGVSPLTLVETPVGGPAPAPAHTSADTPPRAREAAPAAEASGLGGAEPVLEASSVRQVRRREAERLVSTHCPRQPRQVLDRLRAEVLRLLQEDVQPATIASGLRLWACKQLSTSMLAELVGEVMRSSSATATPETQRRAQVTAANWEAMRADAIDEDDTSPIGLAVRAELPAHADAATLDAILERALHQAAGLDVSATGAAELGAVA